MKIEYRAAACASLFVLLLLVPTLCTATPFDIETIAPAADPPQTGNFYTSWAAPTVTPTKPLVIKTTILVNGVPVTKDVEVTGIKRWVDPPAGMFATVDAWYTARVQAMTDASKAKAELVVAAINKAFEKEFTMIGEVAKLDTPIKRKLVAYNNKETELSVINLPSVKPPDPKNIDPKTKQPFYTRQDSPMWLIKDPAGESGGGGTFVPNSPGGKGLGFLGIMGAEDLALTTVATGYDMDGLPSIVSFGIESLYVAEFTPIAGMTDDAVMRALEGLLDYHGLSATYDPLLKELSLDDPVREGQMLVWGNNDPTLDFFAGLGGTEVPEPASMLLLGTGLLIAAIRRTRT